MNKTLFSVIIVSWNSRDLLCNSLKSIPRANVDGNYEIIVVDNGSSDDSTTMVKRDFPDVKLIENNKNFGFAKAVNIGSRAIKGEVILLLNSDAELRTQDTFYHVEQFLGQNNEIGIVGVNLIFPDGVSQSPGGKFISNWQLFKSQILFLDSPVFHRLKGRFCSAKDNGFYKIDYISGTCLFARRKVFEELGGLDERFFMYGEDMEFCYRAKQADWQVGILPMIQVVHLKSQSTKKNFEKTFLQGIKNNCYLIFKFHGRLSAFIAQLIYMIGLFIRFVLSFFRRDVKPTSYLRLISQTMRLSSSF